jgi:AICAR transformylase/IMP cyclohydrolase PurH
VRTASKEEQPHKNTIGDNPTGGQAMTTSAQATHRTVTTERQDLHQIIDTLSDDRIIKLVERAKLLIAEQEIAALEAKYGTTPNAETIAAMKEAEAGIGESITLEQIWAECNALR